MITRHASQLSNAFSMSGCQGSPGMRFHLSSQGVIPASSNRPPRSSTIGLSSELCERKTSWCGFEPWLMIKYPGQTRMVDGDGRR